MGDEIPRVSGDFAVGTQVAGYILREQIGWGGMAAVYRCYDVRLERWVALKILAPEIARDSSFRQRFIFESRAAAAVDHPHIIPVFEAGEADGVLFIAMRYVGGGDVRKLIRQAGPLDAGRAVGIVAQVASALDAAHAAGLVHRDVKPANMLLGAVPGGGYLDHVYLTDFGLSRQALSATGPTVAGQFVGTLDYMAPEQIKHHPVDGRADQYALACAAYEMLAGEPPFRREQDLGLMWAQLAEPPPLLTSLRPDLPEAIDEVLARAMAKSPDDRYESCLDFAVSLAEACGLEWGATGQLLAGRLRAGRRPAPPLTAVRAAAARMAAVRERAGRPAALEDLGNYPAALRALGNYPAALEDPGGNPAALRALGNYPAPQALGGYPAVLGNRAGYPAALLDPAGAQAALHDRGSGSAGARRHPAKLGFPPAPPSAAAADRTDRGRLVTAELEVTGLRLIERPPDGLGPDKLGLARRGPDGRGPDGPGRYSPAPRGQSSIIAATVLVVILAITGAIVLGLRGGATPRSGSAVPAGISPAHQGSPGQRTSAASPGSPARPAGPARPASPGRPGHPGRPAGAAAAVRAYFAAINRHDYRRAWRLGGRNSSPSYAAFAQGFASTSRDTLIILSVSGNVVTARLVAQQTDGTFKTYQGTYAVRAGIIAASDVRQIG